MRVTKVKSPKATPAKRPPPPVLKARRSLPLASERGAVKKGEADVKFLLDEHVGYRLRRAYQRASNVFTDLMAQFDITPTQFSTLAKLDEMGAMSQHQLARVTGLEHAEMIAVIGRLQRQALIRCRPSPLDHRLIEIELTGDAQLAMIAMKDAATKVSQTIAAPLTPAESKQLVALLAKIA